MRTLMKFQVKDMISQNLGSLQVKLPEKGSKSVGDQVTQWREDEGHPGGRLGAAEAVKHDTDVLTRNLTSLLGAGNVCLIFESTLKFCLIIMQLLVAYTNSHCGLGCFIKERKKG